MAAGETTTIVEMLAGRGDGQLFLWHESWCAVIPATHKIAQVIGDQSAPEAPEGVRAMLERVANVQRERWVPRRWLFRTAHRRPLLKICGVWCAAKLAIQAGAFAQMAGDHKLSVAPADVGFGDHPGLVFRGAAWTMVIAPTVLMSAPAGEA